MSLAPELAAAGSAPVPTDSPQLDVTVVLPCLDEREAVGDCVRRAREALATAGLRGEVLVVDNGSRDGSGAVAAAAGARVVEEPRRGYGAAYQRGFAEARGQAVVMADADGSYDLADLPRFVAELERSGADLVMGNRFGGRILPGAMPWAHRWIGNPVLSAVLRLLFHTRVSDAHCGMRALRREALAGLGLRTTGMELASEMVVAAARRGLRIVEIPITYHPRAGASKLRSVRDGWRHLRFMLLFAPSALFQLPGLGLMLAGAGAMALLAGGPRQLLGRTWDYHVLLAAGLAFLLGYSLVLFDLLAKTFSMGAGLAPPDRWLRGFHRVFTLERGLVLGLALTAAGALAEAQVVAEWIASGGGALMAVRTMTVGLVLLTAGIQTVFGAFLLSLLLLERR
jgi:hypothetical protein